MYEQQNKRNAPPNQAEARGRGGSDEGPALKTHHFISPRSPVLASAARSDRREKSTHPAVAAAVDILEQHSHSRALVAVAGRLAASSPADCTQVVGLLERKPTG